MKWKSKVASMYTWLNVHLHLITDFEYFKLFQLVIKDTEKQPKLIGFGARGKRRDSSTPEYGWGTSGVQAEYSGVRVEYSGV
jgi:hypothetical protein